MANVESFQRRDSELQCEDNRESILPGMAVPVNIPNTIQQKLIPQNEQLEESIECLTSLNGKEDEINEACRGLSGLLRSLDPNVVFDHYLGILESALCHPNCAVKRMALVELNRVVNCCEITHQLTQDLLLNIVACLKNETSLAKCASSLLVKVSESNNGRNTLLNGDVLDALKSIQKGGDIERFRVFEAIVLIAIISPEALDDCIKSGILQELIWEVETDNVVNQGNALEILKHFTSRLHTLQWLKSIGFLDILASKFNTIDEEPLGSLLVPRALVVFGYVAQNIPKDFFDEYPAVVTVLFECFNSTDVSLLIIAIETVGCIATSVESKRALRNFNVQMKTVIQKIAFVIESFSQTYRARALRSMANIIELKQRDQDEETLRITEEFFHWLSDNPMGLIMTVFRKSFPQLRLAGLHIIKMLAEQEWGQVLIKEQPGLIDFLLDRTMEIEKFCKNAKIAIVKTLIESPTSASVFDPATFARLRKSIRIKISSVLSQS